MSASDSFLICKERRQRRDIKTLVILYCSMEVPLDNSPRHAPPPLTAKPAKGILKTPRAKTAGPASASPLPSPSLLPSPAVNPAPALVWDEVNLEFTSRERGTRQKIEEVETPYAWPGDYSIGNSSLAIPFPSFPLIFSLTWRPGFMLAPAPFSRPPCSFLRSK